MSTHPTAPGPSSPELKTRVANFMRRAEDILTHPLADYVPGFTVSFVLDRGSKTAISAAMDYHNIDVQPLVYLASRMRSIIFLRDDPISLEKLTGLIEREHVGFRGKLKPFRVGFLRWLETPIVQSGTIGEVPLELQTATPQVFQVTSAPVGKDFFPVAGLSSDMYFAELFFNAEYWHSDDDKSAEYEAASPHEREFMAKCAEVRTFHAIPFIRILHNWVVEVRAMGMDI